MGCLILISTTLCTLNIKTSNERKLFHTKKRQKKARCRLYPAEIMIDAHNANDLALLTNTPTQAKSLLHSLDQAARGIGFYSD